VMVIGDAADGFAPLRTWTITAYNSGSGEFTFDRAHNTGDPLRVGDTLLVLARATAATDTTVECSFLNMETDAYVGAVVRCYAGFGKGQWRRIVANDATSVTVDSPWGSNPDVAAFWFIERADWQFQGETSATDITAADQVINMRVQLENMVGRTILAMGFLLDAEGIEGFEDIAPFRIVEVVGSGPVLDGPMTWQPNTETPITGDAMFDETDKSFAIAQDYLTMDANGLAIPNIQIRGVQPITSMSNDAPVVSETMTEGGSGSLDGDGTEYFACVAAEFADGSLSRPSLAAYAVISSAGSTYTLTIDVSSWPAGAVGYRLFVGHSDAKMAFQASDATTPATITFDAPLNVASYGPPDPEAKLLRVRTRDISHMGVWGLGCSAVNTDEIVFTGSAWTDDEWIGYTVSLVARNTAGEMAIANFEVTANTADTLTVTPDPDGIVAAGDAFSMRSKPSVAGLVLTDPLWENSSENGGLGLTDDLSGVDLWIIAGKGAGYRYPIESNTSTAITVVGPWIVEPDDTSRYIIVSREWNNETTYELRSDVTTEDIEVAMKLRVDNQVNSALLVTVDVISESGLVSLERLAAFRDIFLLGRVGAASNKVGVFKIAPTATASDILREPVRLVCPGEQIVLEYAVVTVKPGHAPVTNDVIIDMERSNDEQVSFDSLFPSGDANKIVLPVGESTVTITPLPWAVPILQNGDIFKVHTLQGDPATLGMEIVLFGQRQAI
jgi:hypothetical protein